MSGNHLFTVTAIEELALQNLFLKMTVKHLGNACCFVCPPIAVPDLESNILSPEIVLGLLSLNWIMLRIGLVSSAKLHKTKVMIWTSAAYSWFREHLKCPFLEWDYKLGPHS